MIAADGFTSDSLSEDSSEIDAIEYEPETKNLFELVRDSISSLFRLSVLIRDATPRDRFAKAVSDGRPPISTEADIDHVFNKYPKLRADDWSFVRIRLGKMNALRRQVLRYSREHQLRKANGDEPQKEGTIFHGTVNVNQAAVEHQDLGTGAEEGNASRKPESAIFTAASTYAVPQIADVATEMLESDDALSQATSLASSFGQDQEIEESQVFRLSEISVLKAHFMCPYCWTIQRFKSGKAWQYVILLACSYTYQ